MKISDQLRQAQRSSPMALVAGTMFAWPLPWGMPRIRAELAALLKKRWRNVKFDPKRGTGSAKMGQISITFEGSQTVHQTGQVRAFDAQSAAKVLEKINTLLGGLG